MMNKNNISKYLNLDINKDKLSNPSFDQKIEKNLTNDELWRITKNHLKRIIWLEKELKSLKNNIEQQLNLIEELVNLNKDFKNALEKSREELLKLVNENNSFKSELVIIKNGFEKNIDKLTETEKQLKITKRWFWWFISVFVIVFLWWCVETFYKFSEVKTDYINKTKEFEKQIELFKKEQEELKEDNQNLKETIKNEIEKDIYKTILEKN